MFPEKILFVSDGCEAQLVPQPFSTRKKPDGSPAMYRYTKFNGTIQPKDFPLLESHIKNLMDHQLLKILK